VNPLLLRETERIMSFFFTGGLVAVHADGRNRASIWNALSRREVYGTSGPRILLWFDLLNPPGTAGETLPMGSDVELAGVPVFRVRAVGSFEQKPGCPEDSVRALAPDRLARLCGGECYHPSDARRAITRIEVVRIRPRLRQDEPLAPLIDDPWRSFPCEADAAGCEITFSDVDFPTAGRDTVYYARAIEAPSRAVNGAQLGCEVDARGRCQRVTDCGNERGPGDDCLAEIEERAWSSPIFVDRRRSAPATHRPVVATAGGSRQR
jgi:hypothetical protein